MMRLEPGIHVVSLHDGRLLRSIADDGLLSRVVAVLADDDGPEPITLQVRAGNGWLEITEINGRCINVHPVSSNSLTITAERRFS